MSDSITLVQRASRISLAAILLGVGGMKIISVVQGIQGRMLLPPLWIAGIGVLESGVGLLLCLSRQRIVSWLALCMAVSFLAVTTLAMIRGWDAEYCGCFGTTKVGREAHFVLALGLVVLAGSLVAGHRSTSASQPINGS